MSGDRSAFDTLTQAFDGAPAVPSAGIDDRVGDVRPAAGPTALRTALELLRLGFHPVAIHPGEKRPIGSGWGLASPTEGALHRTYASHPAAGVGVCLGPGKAPGGGWLADIEVDGPEGEESFLRLVGGEVLSTMGWASVRGPHRLFVVQDDFLAALVAAGGVEGKGASGSASYHLAELPGLEFRVGGYKSDGSVKQTQSACPPTRGTDGRPRFWEGPLIAAELPDAAIAELEAIAERAAKRAECDPRPQVVDPGDGGAWSITVREPAGKTPEERARLYLEKVEPAISGRGGSVPTFRAACKLVEFGLDRETAFRLLRDVYNPRCVPPWSEPELRHKLEGAFAKAEPGKMTGDRSGRPDGASAGSPAVGDEWPALRIGAAPAVDPFPLDVLPGPATRIVCAAAESIGCPVDFVAVGVLGAASAAIGRSAELEIKQGYRESASLFIAAVGGPSSGKSPAIAAALAPVRAISTRLHADWEREYAAWKKAKEEERGEKPLLERIYTTDPTTEALGPILQANPRGMAITPDELTKFILGMDQYKGGKGGDRPFYLSAWSGHPVQVDRAKNALEPIYVPHPFLTVAGGLTPDMTSSLAEGEGRDDGFTARVLFAYPDPVARPYSEEGIPPSIAEDWRRLVEGLWARKMVDTSFGPRPNVVAMTPEARRAWADACNAHRAEMQAVDFPRSLEGAWGKLEQYAGRLALILHLLHDAAPLRGVLEQPPPVQASTIGDAWRLVGYFKSHALRFHAQGRATVIPDDARSILTWAVRGGRSSFSEAKIREGVKQFRDDQPRLAAAILWMRDKGAIRPVKTTAKPEKKGRKPTPAWELHPAIAKGGVVR